MAAEDRKVGFPKYLGAIGLFYTFEKDEIYVPSGVSGAIVVLAIIGGIAPPAAFFAGMVIWYYTFKVYRLLKKISAGGALRHFLYQNSFLPPISSSNKADGSVRRLLKKRKIIPYSFEKEFIS